MRTYLTALASLRDLPAGVGQTLRQIQETRPSGFARANHLALDRGHAEPESITHSKHRDTLLSVPGEVLPRGTPSHHTHATRQRRQTGNIRDRPITKRARRYTLPRASVKTTAP